MTAATALAGGAIGGLSLLLGLAGVGKLLRPLTAAQAATAAGVPHARVLVRVLALLELAVTVAALALPGRWAGALLAAAFASLGLGSALAARRLAGHPCGCFGDDAGGSLGPRHVIVNLSAALVASAAAVAGPRSLIAVLDGRPAAGIARLALAAALALVLRAWLTGGLDRSATGLVDSSARLLETRVSRRSLLTRVALGGSALAIAPLRYLLYPVNALAVVVPSDCGSGLCTDGYTAFCCEINRGLNECPADTFAGGWWMCTDYRGTQLCAGTGVRYYVDCNALPHQTYPGGCRCAGDHCGQRRIACNVFRYGQCNTHVRGTTVVVCRMVTCQPPASIPSLNCSASRAVDDAVCGHEAPCLEPMAGQLPGVGGA